MPSEIPRPADTEPGTPDPVHNPPHYTRLDPQPLDVTEAWGMGHHESSAVKYLARAGHKRGADRLTDLRKAAEYIRRAIALEVRRFG
jgi:hypothetical protein